MSSEEWGGGVSSEEWGELSISLSLTSFAERLYSSLHGCSKRLHKDRQ